MARTAKQQSAFWEQYKHPNWQRKRLEILERDEFSCTNCGSTEKQLQVHHAYYERDTNPWDYPDESLHTLCEDCHPEFQEKYNEIKRLLGQICLGSCDTVIGFLRGMAAIRADNESVQIDNGEHIEGLSYYFDVCASKIYDLSFEKDGTRHIMVSDLESSLVRRRDMWDQFRQHTPHGRKHAEWLASIDAMRHEFTPPAVEAI